MPCDNRDIHQRRRLQSRYQVATSTSTSSRCPATTATFTSVAGFSRGTKWQPQHPPAASFIQSGPTRKLSSEWYYEPMILAFSTVHEARGQIKHCQVNRCACYGSSEIQYRNAALPHCSLSSKGALYNYPRVLALDISYCISQLPSCVERQVAASRAARM
jgi:hypothetical protein